MIPSIAGIAPSSAAIAAHYDGLLDGLVVERGDGEGIGLAVLETSTVMRAPEDRPRLAGEVLRFAEEIGT
jgi:LPPG:FO 2-phospho-L-lactate transferase